MHEGSRLRYCIQTNRFTTRYVRGEAKLQKGRRNILRFQWGWRASRWGTMCLLLRNIDPVITQLWLLQFADSLCSIRCFSVAYDWITVSCNDRNHWPEGEAKRFCVASRADQRWTMLPYAEFQQPVIADQRGLDRLIIDAESPVIAKLLRVFSRDTEVKSLLTCGS